MRDRQQILERKLLIGVATENRSAKSPKAPRKWQCFVQGANGEDNALSFVRRMTLKVGGRRETIHAPGPYVLSGEDSADCEVRIRMTSIDFQNMQTFLTTVPIVLSDPKGSAGDLMSALSKGNPGKGKNKELYEKPNIRHCTIKGKQYTLTYWIETLIFEFPYRKIRNCLEMERPVSAFPCVLDKDFAFFPDEEAGSREFFEKAEASQLEYLDTLIAQIQAETVKMVESEPK